MAESLVIQINGDISNFQDSLESAQKQTEKLESALASTAKISGVAFAALTAIIGTSIGAYAEQEQAEQRLNAVLKSTGQAAGITADEVLALTDKYTELTTYQDDAILSAQNVLLTYTKIHKDAFPRATEATLDLAAGMKIDLSSAADIVGKAMQNPADAVDKFGKTIGTKFTPNQKLMIEQMQKSGDIAGAQAILLQELEKRYGGTANALTKGTGEFIQIKKAMGEVYDAIGKELAPQILKLTIGFKDFFLALSKNEAFIAIASKALLIGAAIAGVVTSLTLAASAFLKVRSVIIATQAVVQGMTLSVRGLVGATGIGLLVVVLSYVALNWQEVFKKMSIIFNAFANNITEVGKGLATFLRGVFSLDASKVKEGFNQVKEAFAKGFGEVKLEFEKMEPVESPLAPDPENTKLKFQADREAAEEEWNKDLEIKKARMELQKEETAFQRQLELEEDQEYRDIKLEQDALNNAKEQKQIEGQRKTVLQTQRDLENERLKKQVETNNTYLRNQQQFGTAYAEINKATSSEIFQGTKQAASDLAQLQQSENSKLKAIGKAAAVTDILMNGILAAQRVFTGLSTIPIIGPVLGGIAAAAAIAGSVERANKVRGMAKGGVVTGGIPGVDSVPLLAQRNEIVSPAQNFDEVIGSVRAKREADRLGMFGNNQNESQGEGGGVMEVIVGFKEDFFEVVEKNLLKRRALGIGNI